ncbi:MAG: flavodoxin family protein [Desulfovibrio sp.]|nr:flavodoxin family protein [Desulfovibrio sp.]
MATCILYSSQTGNTKFLADALARELDLPLYPVETPPPDSFSTYALGFWLKRGMPDEKMLAFMKTLWGKDIYYFCTHAAWPDSEHVRSMRLAVARLLEAQNNRVLGFFTCQGRVAQTPHHRMTVERRMRLEEAERHPDAADTDALIHGARLALFGI